MAQPGNKIPNENPSFKEKRKKAEQLVCKEHDEETEHTEIRLKYMRLRKEIDECQKIHELSVEREKKLKEQQEEFEKMHKEMEKYKKDNNILRIKTDEKEASIRELQKKLDHYDQLKRDFDELRRERDHILNRLNLVAGARQNSHIPEVDHSKDNGPTKRSEEDVSVLSKDNKNNQDFKLQTADEKIQSLQTENASLISALANTSTKIEDLLNKCKNLQKYKTDTDHTINDLLKAMEKKENEIETLNKQLARFEENVSILSKDINDIQESKRQADEKLQSLQTENVSLKSALANTTEYKDLSRALTNVQQDKENAENQISRVSKTLHYKEKELESVQNELARAEKNVSFLSKDIKDIQESKRQVADELESLQTENISLKSDLSKATFEIEDLLNKDTNLQKYKLDAEHKTSTLMDTLKEKETKIETLKTQLSRAEKDISILSENMKDIRESKRQAADERLRGLQKENASLKADLSKASNEIEDFAIKGTSLQKYKTDAEHKISTLMNALQEKETEIEALNQHLARSEENVSILSKDIRNIQESKRQVADEKLQDLQTENASLKLTLAEANTEIDDLWNKCTKLQKYESETEHKIKTLLDAVEEKDTEIENLHKRLARSEKNVSILSKDIKDIQGSKHRAAAEKVQGLKTENASLQLELAKATTEIDALRNKFTSLQKYKTDTEHTIKTLLNAEKEKEAKFEALNEQLARKNNELSKAVSNLQKDKENAEHQRNSFSKALGEKEKDIRLIRNEITRYKENISTLTKYVEEIQQTKNQAADENIKILQKKIDSSESDLRSVTSETDKRVSDLTKEIQKLKKSKGTSSEEFNARKLYEENEFLKAQLDRTSKSYEQLRKDYNEVKREKDHALNRLSSVAGEKQRNNNPGIADLSDENRPINLGEKFSQLYDDQWTDAIEHLEEMGYSETNAIRCLLDILKAVFDECVKLSDNHFNQLKELTGTSHLPSDQLKKLKDLRKATAIHSVAKTKQLVNDYMSTAFSKEKAACQTYIDRSIELCWLMSVQDPPVVIDFIAIHGQAIDDKILRKFTKTGSKIDFLVWPVIRLHKNGPLLQKGVVQPI